MFLYPYALPINHLSLLYSSLCLSCSLSQTKDHNMFFGQTIILVSQALHGKEVSKTKAPAIVKKTTLSV